MTRETMSVVPPVAYGTTIVIAFDGYACAHAPALAIASAKPSSLPPVVVLIASSSVRATRISEAARGVASRSANVAFRRFNALHRYRCIVDRADIQRRVGPGLSLACDPLCCLGFAGEQ